MNNKAIYFFLTIYALLAASILFSFEGTGDAGDSVHHYLFAKYAPSHPELFFNHWAKPLYVLLASPFAQFGFIGVKVFNVLVMTATLFYTIRVAQKLKIKNAIIAALISVAAPLTFTLTFSGLTEPLFALFITIGIHLVLRHKYLSAALVISFLPFIRSEGLIILGVFGVYFMVIRHWKIAIALIFGHVVYSITGYFVHHDILWVFKKIPYAHLSSVYGEGGLFHYAEQLIYVIGIPIYILFGIGCIAILWKTIKRITTTEIQVLIFLCFAAFFIAHTLFWYLGIFNSMGLKRVFVGVMPLIAIISLMGLNFITEDLFQKNGVAKRIIQSVFIAYIIIFPFTSNPAAIDLKRDLELTKDQQIANMISNEVKKEIGIEHRFLYMHPHLSLALDIDHFDTKRHMELTEDILSNLMPGDVIIWENWFCVVERGITKEMLESNSELTPITSKIETDNGRDIEYAVFQYK